MRAPALPGQRAQKRSAAPALSPARRYLYVAVGGLLLGALCTSLFTSSSPRQAGAAPPAQDLPNRTAIFHSQVAVIVELRPNPSFPLVLENIASNLQPAQQWPIQVFYGDNSLDMMRGSPVVPQLLARGRLYLDHLGVDDLNYQQYSQLCLQASFWKRVRGEKILMFQSDSMLCRSTDLSEFLQWDWVGSKWEGDLGKPCYDGPSYPSDSDSTWITVGNGGFSLRSRSAMLEALSTFPYIAGHTQHNWAAFSEDHFFSCSFHLLGKALAPPGVALNFSGAEQEYHGPSAGLHNPQKYGRPEWRERFRSWCPNVDILYDQELQTPKWG